MSTTPGATTTPRRPDNITAIGAMAIIAGVAYLAWIGSNAFLNPEHLPATPEGRVLLFATPTAILWLFLVGPALELLAMRERGRRRMIVSLAILNVALVAPFVFFFVGGLIALFSGVNQWPPPWLVIPCHAYLLPGPAPVAEMWFGALIYGITSRRYLTAPTTVALFVAPPPGE